MTDKLKLLTDDMYDLGELIYEHTYFSSQPEAGDSCTREILGITCGFKKSEHASDHKGIISLLGSVIHDTGGRETSRSKVSHTKLCPRNIHRILRDTKCCEYCQKFWWVIDRANHYSEVTGVPAEEIITAWEMERSYWYLNYYQDSNQPSFDNTTGLPKKIYDTREDIAASFGSAGFICPMCGNVGKSYQECDGRNPESDVKCDWAAYGLFRTAGRGIIVVCKSPFMIREIFLPVNLVEEFPDVMAEINKSVSSKKPVEALPEPDLTDPKTIREKVLKLMQDNKVRTMTQTAHEINERPDSVSSIMKKMENNFELVDTNERIGPRGGIGYRGVRKA